MPGPPVRVTDESRTTMTQLRALLDGDLQEGLHALNRLGTTLADARVWDGPLAESFRDEIWPECKLALEVSSRELAELHRKVPTMADHILAAGGDADPPDKV